MLKKFTIWWKWRVSDIDKLVITVQVSLVLRTRVLLGGYQKIRLCVSVQSGESSSPHKKLS